MSSELSFNWRTRFVLLLVSHRNKNRQIPSSYGVRVFLVKITIAGAPGSGVQGAAWSRFRESANSVCASGFRLHPVIQVFMGLRVPVPHSSYSHVSRGVALSGEILATWWEISPNFGQMCHSEVFGWVEGAQEGEAWPIDVFHLVGLRSLRQMMSFRYDFDLLQTSIIRSSLQFCLSGWVPLFVAPIMGAFHDLHSVYVLPCWEVLWG